jgi:hypothetical protein
MENMSCHFNKISGALVLIVSTDFGNAYGEDGPNASDPLAAVTNTDLRAQYFDLDGPKRRDYYVDGAAMVNPKLKLKYELHYWNTDVTGSGESDWSSFNLKPIYFPEGVIGQIGDWKYKLAVGAEWIVDFGHEDQGIGSGSDQIAPLAGFALSRGDTIMIPLVQHFTEYSGPDVNTTAFRLIVLQAFPDHHMWLKFDNKVPVDWENDNEIPASVEVQLGKNYSPGFATYVDGLFGVGGDRNYDWGVGLGIRFNY